MIPVAKSVATEGTWGHLSGGRINWLAQAEPGSTVGVCGDHADELVVGIKSWLAAAGRQGGVQVLATCDLTKAKKTIGVFGRERPESIRACKNFPKAVALTYVSQSIVVVCNDSDRLMEVMLHEAGHLWGMCDVYPENVIGSGNCDEAYYTGRSRASVMGANYSLALSEADRLGLTTMVERSDVTGNQLWKNFDATGKSPDNFFDGATGETQNSPVIWSGLDDPSDFLEEPIACVMNP